MKKRILPLSLLLFLIILNGCHAPLSFFNLSGPEKAWAIKHPFLIIPAKKATLEARKKSRELLTDPRLDGNPDGGKVDAFRHAYWMALLLKKMKSKKALQLGNAHEKKNYKNFLKKKADEENVVQDSVATSMDLYNNSVGISIGQEHKHLNNDSLAELIISFIREGKMKIIARSSDGSYLDCEGKKLQPADFGSSWKNKRCLIDSR